MKYNFIGRCLRSGVALAPWLIAGCDRAPSFELVGSIFPGWLVCLIIGILLTVFTRWLLRRLKIELIYPILVYPGLTALFTFALWLILFS